jgi:hypothetical protein
VALLKRPRAFERRPRQIPASAPTNGNGKPRVDVIDAMGNSVADMVTNIAQQLSASTDQLSKSRRYTNFAFHPVGRYLGKHGDLFGAVYVANVLATNSR